MIRKVYYVNSDHQLKIWEKEVEVNVGMIVYETNWKEIENNTENEQIKRISFVDEIHILENEIDTIRKEILLGVNPKLEDMLEQKLDILRERKRKILTKL